MRLLASLVTAASLLLAVPAAALTRTVHVPVADCKVTVETEDVFFAANSREIRVVRWGENEVRSDCYPAP